MDAAGRATRALSHHARYERGRVVREAESAAEARELLNSGQGERAHALTILSALAFRCETTCINHYAA